MSEDRIFYIRFIRNFYSGCNRIAGVDFWRFDNLKIEVNEFKGELKTLKTFLNYMEINHYIRIDYRDIYYFSIDGYLLPIVENVQQSLW